MSSDDGARSSVSMTITGEDRPLAIKFARRARNLVRSHPGFTVEKTSLNIGGIVLRILETRKSGQRRRIIMKSSYPWTQEESRKEKELLEDYKYAKHIVNIVQIKPDPMTKTRRGKRYRWKFPYFFLEYLENGTLWKFKERMENTRQILPNGQLATFVLPNRFLWSVFLCMIKACIAMAYPPPGPRNVADSEPLTFSHNDMHQNNWMFGNLDPYDQEHRHIPVLKLIDFGLAKNWLPGERKKNLIRRGAVKSFDKRFNLDKDRTGGRRNYAISRNLTDIGILMFQLISGDRFLTHPQHCREGFVERRRFENWNPDLDPVLERLAMRCLAVDERNQPSIEELATLIKNKTFIKTEADYPEKPRKKGQERLVGIETDARLSDIVSACIYQIKPEKDRVKVLDDDLDEYSIFYD
ncbi:hypothetical protein AAE478_000346 [Parahypoxylon ruwenzoriense]